MDDTEMQVIADRLAEVERKQEAIEADLSEIKADIKELVAAWKAAGVVVAGVKYVASFATAVLALWAAFKLATHGVAHR